MARDPIRVLVIGVEDELHRELVQEEGFRITRLDRLQRGSTVGDVDAVIVSIWGEPLDTLATIRVHAPSAAVVVITGDENAADGTVAMHAGADDHLVRGSIPPGMLPRALRYAVTLRRLKRELSTQDDETGLPNLRGFAPIAEHHLRMADRAHQPAIFLFVRVEGLPVAVDTDDVDRGPALARDAAALVLDAVRDSDVAARISPDTFCVLLTGEARGAEALVLSRLVEAIAVNDARHDRSRHLTLSVGSALYDPDRPVTLEQLFSNADRRLAEQASLARSEDP